jgi:hypothetical protein
MFLARLLLVADPSGGLFPVLYLVFVWLIAAAPIEASEGSEEAKA